MSDDFQLTSPDESPNIDRGRRESVEYGLTLSVSPETARQLDALDDDEVHRTVERALRDVLGKSPDEKEISEARDELREWIFDGNER